MESLLSMLHSQLVLFVYMAAGVYAERKGLLDEQSRKKLTALILQLTLPCMIFGSFNKPLTAEVLRRTGLAFLVALCIALLSFLFGKLLYNFCPREKRSILEYCTLVNNSGFLGMPLVSSVFGEEGLLIASIFIIPNRILMWTAGLSLFTQSDFRTRLRNILLNPCIVTVYLGLFRRLLNLPFPSFLDTAVSRIGALTSPLSMMLIGTMLLGVRWRELLEPAIFYQSFVRLLALPFAALGILRLLHCDPLVSGVSLALTGMPAGSTAVLLATQYGADERFASRLVVSSTVLSLFTAPLMMLLL